MERDVASGRDGAVIGADIPAHDHLQIRTEWVCEKWSEEACNFAQKKLERLGTTEIQDGVELRGTGRVTWDNTLQREVEEVIAVPRLIPISAGITSDVLREFIGVPEEVVEIHGNLLLNEGIQRLLDLLIGAGGAAYNNAGSYIGVGTSSTAEAATQTELQGTQDSANRFYKVMVATYPIRTAQTMDFRSDFTGTEANFAWNEWTVAAGATTASGSGFLVGTTNLNRKVQSLGTKASGTWTMTGSVTIS